MFTSYFFYCLLLSPYCLLFYQVRLKGFEPLAHCLEGSCSIQLSYRRKSGREDSNLRPPAPKAGALAKLRYAP